jgi:hypothetical protein
MHTSQARRLLAATEQQFYYQAQVAQRVGLRAWQRKNLHGLVQPSSPPGAIQDPVISSSPPINGLRLPLSAPFSREGVGLGVRSVGGEVGRSRRTRSPERTSSFLLFLVGR